MSKKKKQLYVKYDDKTLELLRETQSSDGSKYLIPAPSENPDGLHFSVHKSGIINLRNRNKSIDLYNLSQETISQEIFQNLLANKIILKYDDLKNRIKYAVVSNLIKHPEKFVSEDKCKKVIDLQKFSDVFKSTAQVLDVKNEEDLKSFIKLDPNKETVEFIDDNNKVYLIVAHGAYFMEVTDETSNILLKLLETKQEFQNFI